MTWSDIEFDLKRIYQKYNLLHIYDNDKKYLEDSFHKIESMWMTEYNKLNSINIILISESPLFGKEENYIYNTNTPPSSFFRFNDIKFLPNFVQFKQTPNTNEEKKEIMINQFIKSGVIVLDIFPFPLNKKDTIINYQNMSKKFYNDILDYTKDSYLIPKLKLCLDKTHNNSYFLYRYKRLYDKTDNHLENVLKEIGRDNYKIDTIHSNNIPIDRNKLYALFHQ